MFNIVSTFRGSSALHSISGDEALVGRGPNSEKVEINLIQDRSVSRCHAQIWSEGGETFVKDLGSRHGTSVNGHPLLEDESRAVHTGDTVLAGETMLTIDLDPESKSRFATEACGNEDGESASGLVARTLPPELRDDIMDGTNSGTEGILLYEMGLEAGALRRLLGTFSPKVRGALIEKARIGRLSPGPGWSEVAILSATVGGFTEMIPDLTTPEYIELVNAYYPVVTEEILRHDGALLNTSNGIFLAVFGSPEPDLNHSVGALSAAIDIQSALGAFNRQRGRAGRKICRAGIGIHVGEALHGFVGGFERLEFTVVGNTVDVARWYGESAGSGEIIISPELYGAVGSDSLKADSISIDAADGKSINAYRLLRLHDPD